jgi:nitroimidazol reductase NimA-like FMN-containing flavoprotein (pyridoxamine 5'-phosphate oxidase superfamily)
MSNLGPICHSKGEGFFISSESASIDCLRPTNRALRLNFRTETRPFIYLMIYGSFNEAVNSSEYTVSNGEVRSEWWIRKNATVCLIHRLERNASF